MMSLRIQVQVLMAAITLFVGFSSASQATVLLDNNFDDATLQDWSADAGGVSVFTFNGTGIDFSTSSSSAASLFSSGGNGMISTNVPLLLDTQGYTSLDISFDWSFQNGSSTRRANLQYSEDGTNFANILTFNTGFSAPTPTFGSSSITLNEGAFNFTDAAKFRFTFGSNRSDHIVFIDNVLITGSPDFEVIPEPATAGLALIGFGGLLMRRRNCTA